MPSCARPSSQKCRAFLLLSRGLDGRHWGMIDQAPDSTASHACASEPLTDGVPHARYLPSHQSPDLHGGFQHPGGARCGAHRPGALGRGPAHLPQRIEEHAGSAVGTSALVSPWRGEGHGSTAQAGVHLHDGPLYPEHRRGGRRRLYLCIRGRGAQGPLQHPGRVQAMGKGPGLHLCGRL
jgi:hypothetical protein